MKKIISAFIFFTIFTLSSFAQQNDIIISKTESSIRYKHEQNFNYGFDKEYKVYENPSEENFLFKLPYGTGVQILEIEVQTAGENESVWYKIEYNNQTGWIKANYNPYKNGNWEILETIQIDGVDKIVRQVSDNYKLLTFHDHGDLVTIYSAPSAKSEVIFSTANDGIPATVISMTDKTELCKIYSSREEYWVKIRLNDIEGWIFGSQLASGRGGPKYPIPNNMIRWNLEAGGV